MQTIINNLKFNPKFRFTMFVSFLLTFVLLALINSNNGDDTLPNAQLVKQTDNSDYSYVCIVDAGSTGSRIHVYKYKQFEHPNSNELISVDVENEEYKKFYPGLSSFEDKPTDIKAMGDYFEPILNFGRDKVPLSQRTKTPLFVLASAGMRKVRDRNAKIAKQVMDSAYSYLSQSSEFIVMKDGIKIIEGRNEGLWGWIAANYLNGELSNLLKLKPSQLYTSHTTKGVMEMGGESLQITFIPDKSSLDALNKHNAHIESVTIGTLQFDLFSYSWMGIGMEAAQNKYDSYLVTQKKERKVSPCYLKGFVRERAHGMGQAVQWNGSGNFDECYNGLSTLIDERLKAKCTQSNDKMLCTPNNILMPKIDLKTSQFYYIENFYYTAHVLGLLDVHGLDFLKKLKEKGQSYCFLDMKEAAKQYSEASEEEIQKTCFCAAWLLAILNKGFDLEQFSQFKVIRDIEGSGGSIDWVLGFLIAEVPNMDISDDAAYGLGSYALRFLLIAIVMTGIMYCLYQGINAKNPTPPNSNPSPSAWLYSKLGIGTNKKAKSSHSYKYQQINNRRNINVV